MHREITVEKVDVLKSIYFIAEMAQNTGAYFLIAILI